MSVMESPHAHAHAHAALRTDWSLYSGDLWRLDPGPYCALLSPDSNGQWLASIGFNCMGGLMPQKLSIQAETETDAVSVSVSEAEAEEN